MSDGNNNKNKNGCQSRCAKCSKKSHMLIKCPCDGQYCLSCRFPDQHECSYNFKKEHDEKLRKENPQVSAEKIHNKL
jgi:predicted nucleic acid binding AN1-type Zn finger protein